MIFQKFEQFEKNMTPHPAASSNIASSDYHLFSCLQNLLKEGKMKYMEMLRKEMVEYFSAAASEMSNRRKSIVKDEREHILY